MLTQLFLLILGTQIEEERVHLEQHDRKYSNDDSDCLAEGELMAAVVSFRLLHHPRLWTCG